MLSVKYTKMNENLFAYKCCSPLNKIKRKKKQTDNSER